MSTGLAKTLKKCVYTVSKETIKTDDRIEGKYHKIKTVRLTHWKDFMQPQSRHPFLPGGISPPIE